MLIAVKFWKDSTDRPEGIPLDWPWKQMQIEPKDAPNYSNFGWRVFNNTEFKKYIAERQEQFDWWFKNHSSLEHPERLKIYDLVKDEFKFYHPSKIDFRRHLKTGVNLQKTVSMLMNGRPEKSEYWLNGSKICEIRFDFVTDPFNFMLKRTEMLGYVTQSNVILEYYPIHDQDYNPMDTHHARERIRERVEARTIILDEIKAKVEQFLFGYLTAQGQTYIQILTTAGEFWSAYASIVSSWQNTGTTAFKDQILADTTYGFLDYEIPASLTGAPENYSIRNYIAWRVTY